MSSVRVRERGRIKGSTIAIIVLSVMLVASIAVGVTLAYFTANASAAGNVGLGDPVNINITQGGSTVTSLTFSDDALPGHVYDQVIGVSVPVCKMQLSPGFRRRLNSHVIKTFIR